MLLWISKIQKEDNPHVTYHWNSVSDPAFNYQKQENSLFNLGFFRNRLF